MSDRFSFCSRSVSFREEAFAEAKAVPTAGYRQRQRQQAKLKFIDR